MKHPHVTQDQSAVNRRDFITRTALSAGALALLGVQPSLAGNGLQSAANTYTVQDVIELILKEGKLQVIPNTVDTIKAGSPGQTVTGIVTTMFTTTAVIEQAAQLNANFIIAHEPTFYNHTDNPAWVPGNAVVKQKQQLLEKYNMAVWRFHDYCHALKPDAISYGVVQQMNWQAWYKQGDVVLTIPQLSLQQLVNQLKQALHIAHVRVIGNLEQPCSRIALLPGAWGGVRQVTIAETQIPDVLVVGEVSEWETAEYIRDAHSMGKKTALVILGHAQSEEPGMAYVANWLQPKLNGITVTHIASGSPFTWV
ncbi:Nif3-like dinuclear metal center hexameric protein [Deminuibacter soli]|uniref:NGG1p interacting factor NIF3 n=1 Tax=Deminuibacter soli TaxID=2291815 RepID=A0A3E1NP16_9BACT|nr:Nif3-like dinuclear metal center hexameric protein [Deminuibacter soli]RFM29663.1 hypothetical protein DXN05_01385 [Deminuibacter soli]